MNFGKGLGFAGIGALVGAVLWVFVVDVTGMKLWPVAVGIGAAAGYGMMRAMKMRGGFPAGALAAAVSLAAIVGAHYVIASQESQRRLAVTEEDVLAHYTDALARDMAKRGLPTRDKAGVLLPKVERRAREELAIMTWEELQQYTKARHAEKKAAAGTVAPWELAFNFGVNGTICVVVSVLAALITGSIKRGTDEEGEAVLADGGKGKGRKAEAEPRPSFGGQWSIPVQAKEERPIPKIKVVSSDDGESKAA